MIRKLEQLHKAREILNQKVVVVFSMDIDWASEYAVSKTLEYFLEKEIPLTAFLTHPSQVLSDALSRGDIKGGIHPNFMPDSSQGKNFDEVIKYCFNLLPDAKCFRAHRYFDVNDIMDKMVAKGILYESNICTLLDNVPPFLHRSGMIGFPIFWEDGGYLFQQGSLKFEDIKGQLYLPGLKVINFHPMHFMLNTPYFTYTREIKDSLSRSEWNNLNEKTIDGLRYKGRGITSFIKDMVDDLQRNQVEICYMDDIYQWICSL